MKKAEAIKILRLENESMEHLKKQYKIVARENHPDLGGDLEIMKMVNLAYETLLNQKYEISWADNTADLLETYRDIIVALRPLEGIEIELIGTWLWVSGSGTYSNKKLIKKLGLRWSRNKQSWYIYTGKFTKRNNKNYSLEEIRSFWGSQKIDNDQNKIK